MHHYCCLAVLHSQISSEWQRFISVQPVFPDVKFLLFYKISVSVWLRQFKKV